MDSYIKIFTFVSVFVLLAVPLLLGKKLTKEARQRDEEATQKTKYAEKALAKQKLALTTEAIRSGDLNQEVKNHNLPDTTLHLNGGLWEFDQMIDFLIQYGVREEDFLCPQKKLGNEGESREYYAPANASLQNHLREVEEKKSDWHKYQQTLAHLQQSLPDINGLQSWLFKNFETWAKETISLGFSRQKETFWLEVPSNPETRFYATNQGIARTLRQLRLPTPKQVIFPDCGERYGWTESKCFFLEEHRIREEIFYKYFVSGNQFEALEKHLADFGVSMTVPRFSWKARPFFGPTSVDTIIFKLRMK